MFVQFQLISLSFSNLNAFDDIFPSYVTMSFHLRGPQISSVVLLLVLGIFPAYFAQPGLISRVVILPNATTTCRALQVTGFLPTGDETVPECLLVRFS